MNPPRAKPPLVGLEIEWHILGFEYEVQHSDFFKRGEMLLSREKIRVKKFLESFPGYLDFGFVDFVPRSSFLESGGRAYFDSPGDGYFESATPEASSILSLVRYAKRDEWAVEVAVRKFNALMRLEGLFVQAFKANLDSDENTRGAHENYLIAREGAPFEEYLKQLGPHLITRIFYTGNGWISAQNNRLIFCLSQRARKIKTLMQAASTDTRPLLNIKDEPHADEKKYRRLHLSIGDSLIAEPALFLQFGTTYIINEMIQDNYLALPFDPEKFLAALETFNADDSLKKTADMGGGTYTAVDIQETYLKHAQKFYAEQKQPSDEIRQILALWAQMVDFARRPDPHSWLAPYVDGSAKRMILLRELSRRGFDWNVPADTKLHPKKGKKESLTIATLLAVINLQFHENSPKGLARRLIQSGGIERITTDEEIEQVKKLPLNENRAVLRTARLREAFAHSLVSTLTYIQTNWDKIVIQFLNEKKTTYAYPEPSEFLEKIQTES